VVTVFYSELPNLRVSAENEMHARPWGGHRAHGLAASD